MDVASQIDGLLRGVGQPLGLDLSLDDTGRCGLSFGKDLVAVVAALEISDDVLFFATIASLPSTDSSSVMELLLSLNLHAAETDGATLGIDLDQGVVVLSRRWPCQMLSPETFGILLGNFLATADRINQTLSQYVPSASTQKNQVQHASSDDLLRNFLLRA